MSEIIPTGSLKELGDQAIYFMVQSIGLNESMQLFDEWQSIDKISRKAKSDLKLKVKKIINDYANGERNDLIQELDNKIEESVRYFR